MTTTNNLVASTAEIRSHFPALERKHNGFPVAYFDGPGGTRQDGLPLALAVQVVREGLGAGVAAGGVLLQAFADDGFQVGRALRAEGAQGLRIEQHLVEVRHFDESSASREARLSDERQIVEEILREHEARADRVGAWIKCTGKSERLIASTSTSRRVAPTMPSVSSIDRSGYPPSPLTRVRRSS